MRRQLRQLQNFIGHDGIINTVCLGQRTGQIYATGGDDRYCHVWLIGANTPRCSFGPFPSATTSCTFNTIENQLLCGNNDGTITLCDLTESRCISNWTTHQSSVHSLAFNPDNSQLMASCSSDRKIHIFSAQQRRPIQTYGTHIGRVNHVSYSADGKYVASCGADKTVRVFDLIAQREFVKFQTHTESVTSVEFHPTQSLLISCGCDRSTRFFDLINLCQIPASFPLDSSPIDVVRFATNDSVAFSVSADYIQVVGWEPPEFFDHFPVGLERANDLSFIEGVITIASSTQNRVLIHRMNATALKPWSVRQQQQPLFMTENKARSPTPRLLDPSAMPIPQKRNIDKPEICVFQEFRKSRAPFMTTMNDRFSRLTHVDDLLDGHGLMKMLAVVAENGVLGLDVLIILRMVPTAVKLEHAPLVMRIAMRSWEMNEDLALSTVLSMLQRFGKLVKVTRSVDGSSKDGCLIERKKQCELFVGAFRELATRLQNAATGNSASARTAAEILADWRMFLT
jgi:hypothetical protein